MRYKILWHVFVACAFLMLPSVNRAGETDSLSHYMETAAENNPQLKAGFLLYKAALAKVPQAGAFPDPELDMGFYVKPMEALGGRQIANFSLMQMFPWFGTRKAARSEAQEMARMAYEEFRTQRDELFYQVKAQWYQLCLIQDKIKSTQANIGLLMQLEQLALRRFSASSADASSSGNMPVASSAPSMSARQTGGMGGMAMGGTAGTAPSAGAVTASQASGMDGMSGSSMGGGGMRGGMSEVLRIQMEQAELENALSVLLSQKQTAEYAFNALLGRELSVSVVVPDSLLCADIGALRLSAADELLASNPMLAMAEAEASSFQAKGKMDKRMGMPMIGIGLQYMLVGKRSEEMAAHYGMPGMNGMDMVMPMLKLSIPLGRKKYNAMQNESEYRMRASRAKYADTQNTLLAEHQRLTNQLDDAQRTILLYEKQCKLSQTAWRLVVREFAAGVSSLSDVITVERQLLDYRLKRSEAVADYNTQVAGLEKISSNFIKE